MSLENAALNSDDDAFVDELKPGTKLMLGQYTIEDFLAAGGFGITYVARDSLNRRVVIKECFPGSLCRRQNSSVTPRSRAHQNELASIIRLFSQEALNLAKANHPNIVGVHQVFEENNTAYMALDYVHGHDLLEILEEDPDSLKPALVESYLLKILDAVGHIHQRGILHRDISPDNIIINEVGEPILIDFGAARESTNEKVTRMLSALRVVKDGYSPQEFYIAGSEQSPSCDLYSLAASFYHVITGELPPDSQWRLSARAANDADPYVSLGEKTDAYSKDFVEAMDKAMSILPRDRMQSAEEWIARIGGATAASATSPAAGADAKNAIEKKKASYLPLLLGTTAVAATIGAGFFLIAPSGTEVPAGGVDDASVAAVATVGVPQAEPASLGGRDTSTEEASSRIASGVIAAAPTVDSAPEVGDLAEVTGVPLVAPKHNVPMVDDTLDLILPSTLSIAAERVFAAQPRALGQGEEVVALMERSLPDVETEAPAIPVPTVSVDLTDTTPPAPAERDLGALSGVDFFVSMGKQQPDLVSAPSATSSAPAIAAATTEPETSETSSVITRYVPAVPFKLSLFAPGRITSADDNAPAWLNENATIISVNGETVTTNDQIIASIEEIGSQSDARSFSVTLGIESELTGGRFERDLTINMEKHILLLNGLSFVAREVNSVWTTVVTDAPSSSSFEVGDTLVSYVSTWEDINGPDSLKAILDRELAEGRSTFSFAVSRDGEIWVEAFNLASL